MWPPPRPSNGRSTRCRNDGSEGSRQLHPRVHENAVVLYPARCCRLLPGVVNSVTTLNRSKLPRTFAAFQHPAYRIMWSANFSSLPGAVDADDAAWLDGANADRFGVEGLPCRVFLPRADALCRSAEWRVGRQVRPSQTAPRDAGGRLCGGHRNGGCPGLGQGRVLARLRDNHARWIGMGARTADPAFDDPRPRGEQWRHERRGARLDWHERKRHGRAGACGRSDQSGGCCWRVRGGSRLLHGLNGLGLDAAARYRETRICGKTTDDCRPARGSPIHPPASHICLPLS